MVSTRLNYYYSKFAGYETRPLCNKIKCSQSAKAQWIQNKTTMYSSVFQSAIQKDIAAFSIFPSDLFDISIYFFANVFHITTRAKLVMQYGTFGNRFVVRTPNGELGRKCSEMEFYFGNLIFVILLFSTDILFEFNWIYSILLLYQ